MLRSCAGLKRSGISMRKWLLLLAVGFAITSVQPGRVLARQAAELFEYGPGTIIVKTHERRLYYITANGHAIKYAVGVGKAGMTWTGTAYIASKHIRPAWSPPEMIRREKPGIADVFPSGSPRNPMGAAALVLDHDEYAIHGTNAPGSIGHFVSHGCIRMYNSDIMDLYSRVSVGTQVVVLP
jgi:lipoprotein-anchoring transpeptidase ErfK/SrfK